MVAVSIIQSAAVAPLAVSHISFGERVQRALPGQAIMVVAGTSSYALFTPLAVKAITGVGHWLTPFQTGVTATAMFLYSFVVAHGLVPLGNRLQNSPRIGKTTGRLMTRTIETIGLIGLYQGLGLVHGWNPLDTLKTGAVTGGSQSFSFARISERWGTNLTFAMLVRTAYVVPLTATNLAVVNTLAALHDQTISMAELAVKVGLFNLAVWLTLSLPSKRS